MKSLSTYERYLSSDVWNSLGLKTIEFPFSNVSKTSKLESLHSGTFPTTSLDISDILSEVTLNLYNIYSLTLKYFNSRVSFDSVNLCQRTLTGPSCASYFTFIFSEL